MSVLARFFHGSDTHVGVFYPTGYIFAVYGSFENAEQARQQLVLAGLRREQAIAVPGEDVVHFTEEHKYRDGLWGMLMRELSRILATEAIYADHDLNMAQHGAGFLAVNCHSEHTKERVWSRLEQTQPPLVARYYAFGGIEHLKGEA
jgi:hypothetical protein